MKKYTITVQKKFNFLRGFDRKNTTLLSSPFQRRSFRRRSLLINTNNIYRINLSETRNLPRGFILNRFKTLKYFWQALKYFYIM